MDDRAYWIWLQNALGAGSGKLRRILEYYVSVARFYEAGPKDWKLLGVFTKRELNAMAQFTLDDAMNQLVAHENAGLQVITPEDAAYPEKLRQIYDFPAVLYVQGELPDLEEKLSIAIVGTRKATQNGLYVARTIGRELARRDVIVVSGGAMGIDTAAHTSVLKEDGITVCVLGCGIGYRYLPDKEPMRQAITKRGALVSEFPIGTPPRPHNFPIRNRIIAGLCDGTLVVEAGTTSGSLLTARNALEQNRDVFAVPGDITRTTSEGTNNLIQRTAKPVTTVEHILEEYTTRYPYLHSERKWYVTREYAPQPAQKMEKPLVSPPELSQSEAEKPTETAAVTREVQIPSPKVYTGSPEAVQVLAVLQREPQHLSVICEKTGLSVSKILGAVTELEVEDQIQVYSGNRYSLPE